MYHGNFRATTPAGAPSSAWGICDVCSELWDHNRLKFQWDYAGEQMINKGYMACPTCYDKPFTPGKVILIPPDPIPIQNPRPPSWAEQSGYTDPVIPDPWPY